MHESGLKSRFVNSAVIRTPVGPLEIGSVGESAICRISFHSHGRPTSGTLTGLLGELVRQLDAYFAGRLEVFDLPLEPEGTPFQQDVWRMLMKIPYGKTWSYSDVARRIGRPDAVRAVGAANGANPMPIVIPCHRVIGMNGKLVGFGGGLETKKRLLALESGQQALI